MRPTAGAELRAWPLFLQVCEYLVDVLAPQVAAETAKGVRPPRPARPAQLGATFSQPSAVLFRSETRPARRLMGLRAARPSSRWAGGWIRTACGR
jgi:hypothetical protein